MLDRLKRLTAPPVFPDDEEKTRVARLLNVVIWAEFLVIISINVVIWVQLLVITSSLADIPLTGNILGSTLSIVVLELPVVASFFLMRAGRVRLGSGVLITMFWLLSAVLTLFAGGATSSIAMGYLVVIILAGLLLGGPAAAVFAGLSITATVVTLVIQLQGALPPNVLFLSPIATVSPIIANLIMGAALLYLATGNINQALQQARQSNRELQAARASLEERVEERTHELARRSNYLEATTQVARQIAATLELQDLLSNIVNLISERFSFYHTGIFLLDTPQEWAELKAASSAGGKRMLERGHRLRVEERGVVGYAAYRGQARIALDTGADAVFLQNPDLPDTRSEIALPLRARGQTIGVLDVQSTAPQAFGEEDVSVLQTLADQVALAISNARLFQQAQASLEAERRAYGEQSQQAWKQLIARQDNLGFVRDQSGLARAVDALAPKMQAAVLKNQIAVSQDGGAILTVPVQVRGQVIAVVDVERPNDTGQWMPDQIAMMQTLAEQLGVALESARLYQDTQRRAAQERLAGEITARMRESLDVDRVLQTAVREFGQTLGIAEVKIRLTPDDRRAAASG